MKILQLSLSLIIFLCFLQNGFATHNRAGEITYEQIGDATIIATITTYTKATSIQADRDSLQICWGDDTCEMIARINGDGDPLPNDTKKNIYRAQHTYPSQDHFVISMTDPNRNANILNVNPPTSDNVQFHIQTTVTFFNTLINGFNNSPILLQPPIDIGCVGQPFIHNPNAYEPDGDSLAYELIVPLQDVNNPVPNYLWPNQLTPENNTIALDEVTGDFVWTNPQEAGEYNIAMFIIEFRNGSPIDTLIRDMQILIEDCDNLPPEVETIDEICVVAGDLVEFEVIGTDPDTMPVQKVELTALGGPFILDVNPAEFIVPQGFQEHPVSGTFSWQTTCEHISDAFYSVVFKVVDDYPGTSSLFSLKTVRIKVVGPPPLDLDVISNDGNLEVSWENPYECIDVADDYFWDFSVWRKIGSNPFVVDTCTPGLDGRGYELIEIDIDTETSIVDGRYFYKDEAVERGKTYCYRVLAEFAQRTIIDQPYNQVASLASEEFCLQLSRDIPLITNVDVQETDAGNGEIFVQWSKPVPEDLDTIQNPPPYTYELLRATGIVTAAATFTPVASWTSNSFAEANDTSFIDTGLNTQDNAYTYQVAFYANNEPDPIDYTQEASSIYLSVASSDNKNILTWEANVPWKNSLFYIYKRNNDTGVYALQDSTDEATYEDVGLLNGTEYCYFIESYGSYNIDHILDPLLNKSQINCGIPLDTIPPCPPVLQVNNICNGRGMGDVFENYLGWTNPVETCPETDDVIQYNIYYAPTMATEPTFIASTFHQNDTNYTHIPELGIAGCYQVTALDTMLNESVRTAPVCVDNCPEYELPNTFTPNGDGQNDLFIPYDYLFIDHIEMSVFNQWGQVVFTTTNPDIQWDGKNLSGNDLAEGVYYYTCKVFESRVTGVTEAPDILSGFIQLIR